MERGVLRPEHGDRDRKIEGGSDLGELGGREVDRDPSLWEFEPGVADRGLHPLSRLLDGAVGEPDDGEGRQPVGDVGLDRDRDPGEAPRRATYCVSNHTRKCNRVRSIGKAARAVRAGANLAPGRAVGRSWEDFLAERVVPGV